MAIRSVEIKCILDYAQSKIFEAKNGAGACYPRLGVTGFVRGEGIDIRASSGVPGHSALFYVTKDEVTYQGCVVEEVVREERIMSDVWATCRYAIVWDAEKSKFLTVSLGNSEFSGTWSSNLVKVDATAEVLELWNVHRLAESYRDRLLESDRRYYNELTVKMTIANGKTVRVVRGRKVPQGTEGVVFWMRDGRLGLRTSDRRNDRGQWADVVWVTANNCAVVNVRTGRVYE